MTTLILTLDVLDENSISKLETVRTPILRNPGGCLCERNIFMRLLAGRNGARYQYYRILGHAYINATKDSSCVNVIIATCMHNYYVQTCGNDHRFQPIVYSLVIRWTHLQWLENTLYPSIGFIKIPKSSFTIEKQLLPMFFF